jgi:predicted enzyme related to lactoylglutathione lyase
MVGWFEIPVVNMDRAKKFYERFFDITIAVHDIGGFIIGWFPNDAEKSGATGSLVQHAMYKPSLTDGPLIYFSCKDVAIELSSLEGQLEK